MRIEYHVLCKPTATYDVPMEGFIYSDTSLTTMRAMKKAVTRRRLKVETLNATFTVDEWKQMGEAKLITDEYFAAEEFAHCKEYCHDVVEVETQLRGIIDPDKFSKYRYINIAVLQMTQEEIKKHRRKNAFLMTLMGPGIIRDNGLTADINPLFMVTDLREVAKELNQKYSAQLDAERKLRGFVEDKVEYPYVITIATPIPGDAENVAYVPASYNTFDSFVPVELSKG